MKAQPTTASTGQGSDLVRRATAPFSAASRGIQRVVDRLAHLAKFEVVIASLCILIPVLLVAGDGGAVREHISAYFDMQEAQYFYVPLTVAAMLFMVNGLVRQGHWYNFGLGLALGMLTFWNHRDHSFVHTAGAVVFFVGNPAVFVIFTPKKEFWFKLLLAAAMVLAFVLYRPLDVYSLFWAETISITVIAIHFALEAAGLTR